MSPIGALAGLILAAVITCLIPKQYESQAVIELKPIHEHEQWKRDPREGEDETPAWVSNEIGRMKSRESLDEVITRLKLEKHWNLKRENAREILNQSLQIRPIRETDLVSIRMHHAIKVDARDIAHEIANVCKERREKIQLEESKRKIEDLNQAISMQQEKVDSLRQALVRLKKESNPNNEASANAERDLANGQQMLESIRRQLIGEAIAAKIPHDAVLIHEMPRIDDEPVFPNFRLNLVLGTVLGLFISPLMTLLVIRCKREAIPQRDS